MAAVRDLYGTVINEGANRGILVTTSGFGPDFREFVKDKNITLIDGPHLIEMLRRHGRTYRIDLNEARKLNKVTNDPEAGVIRRAGRAGAEGEVQGLISRVATRCFLHDFSIWAVRLQL